MILVDLHQPHAAPENPGRFCLIFFVLFNNMINKRLLVKNLLAYNDENSFYDKKARLDLDTKEGKSKFLKHVCALSNSNPKNNSYIVVGVEDETNRITGVDFFDDSKIQNLINAYFINPPKIQYENVPFPKLPRHKVVGLVTINPIQKITSLKKGIGKYTKGMFFFRQGSNSIPMIRAPRVISNKSIVEAIEKNASNNIELTLNGVFDFFNEHKDNLNATYKVFKDQFVICWAGIDKKIDNKILYSRVDVELINEQIRLFYSALDEVEIEYNSRSFIITEYLQLGLDENQNYYPLEKTVINFKDNGTYDFVTEMLFEPPHFDKILLRHIYNSNNALLTKLQKGVSLTKREKTDIKLLPTTYMICSLNGFKDAKEKLESSRSILRDLPDNSAYISLKEALRILRKVKYH